MMALFPLNVLLMVFRSDPGVDIEAVAPSAGNSNSISANSDTFSLTGVCHINKMKS